MAKDSSISTARNVIRVGVIGLSASGGWAARAHHPALSALSGFEVTALCTSTEATARAAAARFGVGLAFTNPRDLAAADEVDLVVVGVKVPLHRVMVEAAIDAGKPVLCEWPLSTTAEEAVSVAARARTAGIRTAIGLQARWSGAIRYLRDLVRDGYVGEVLSTTLIGSGPSWGGTTTRASHYLLDQANGATMVTIPFGHTIDALTMVLGNVISVQAMTDIRQPAVMDTGSHTTHTKSAADQLLVAGRMASGATLSVHYRGGTSRGTNLLWEINGSDGDIQVVGPSGHMQTGRLTLRAARHEEKELTRLIVPDRYHQIPGLTADHVCAPVAHLYQALWRDMRSAGTTVPDFDMAVQRHQLLGTIERSALAGTRIDIPSSTSGP